MTRRPLLLSLAFVAGCSSCGRIAGDDAGLDAPLDVSADVPCQKGQTFACGAFSCTEPAGCELTQHVDGAIDDTTGCSQEGVPQCGACDTCDCAYPGYANIPDANPLYLQCYCQMREGHTYFTCPVTP